MELKTLCSKETVTGSDPELDESTSYTVSFHIHLYIILKFTHIPSKWFPPFPFTELSAV
jgi:hypothetical protein